jgi:murein DD-endopeptidase MepM/ murein hydrolase activator NlpD
LFGLAVVAVVIAGLYFIAILFEMEKPKVDLGIPFKALGSSGKISGEVSDRKSGLKEIWISLAVNGKDNVICDMRYPVPFFNRMGRVHHAVVDVPVDLKKIGVLDGPARLRIRVSDGSLWGWFSGNVTYQEKDVTLDTKYPEIDLISKNHNLVPGGSGLVIYKVSETDVKSGVRVGDRFFPGYGGYFKDPAIIMAFFALSHLQGPGTNLYIEATDNAGNLTRAGFTHYIANKKYRSDVIPITDEYLDASMPTVRIEGLEDFHGNNLEKFLKINGELRQNNERTILGLGPFTDKTIHWKGPFLRLPGSATRATFADHRTYTYNGKTVDDQYHLGYDLASVRQSDVPASNGGKVVLVDMIGIYGKTVVVDHGFGLYSSYSHLSRVTVEAGQMVNKGDIIGTTGITGLAAGDHLHFGMYIHNVFVDPLQWWDPAWIKNNITSKISAVQPDL